MKLRNFLIVIPLFLSACATPYQNNSLSLVGGYSSQKAEGNLLKISFSGNDYTSENRAQEGVLLRAAQIGKERKKKYFALYQTMTAVAANEKTSEPAVDLSFDKPTAYAYVRYSDVKKSGDLSVDAIYAKYAKRYLNKP